MLSIQGQRALEAEFALPFAVIAEIGEARRADDQAANGFGGSAVYQASPVCKSSVYKKHGLDFARGEEIGWAYIHDEAEEARTARAA